MARQSKADEREMRCDYIRTSLERLARRHEGSPYIVVDHGLRQELGEQTEPFLHELRQLLPRLRQVELIGELKRRPAEERMLEPLLEILEVLD